MIINQSTEENTPIKFTDFTTSFGKDDGIEKRANGFVQFNSASVLGIVVVVLQFLYRIRTLQHAVRIGALGSVEATMEYGIITLMSRLHANEILIYFVEYSLIILFGLTLLTLIAIAVVEYVVDLKVAYSQFHSEKK